jgi:hypothetical protein
MEHHENSGKSPTNSATDPKKQKIAIIAVFGWHALNRETSKFTLHSAESAQSCAMPERPAPGGLIFQGH